MPTTPNLLLDVPEPGVSSPGPQYGERVDAAFTAVDEMFPVSVVARERSIVGINQAIEDAAELAESEGRGATVQAPPGVISGNSGVEMLPRVRLKGHGWYRTSIVCTSPTANIVSCIGTPSAYNSVVALEGIELQGGVARTAGAGVHFEYVQHYILDNIRFVDTFNAATFLNAQIGALSRIRLAKGTGTLNRGYYWKNCVDTHCWNMIGNGGLGAFAQNRSDPSAPGGAHFWIDSGNDTWAGVDIGAGHGRLGGVGGGGVGFQTTNTDGSSNFAPRLLALTNYWFEGSDGTVRNPVAQPSMILDALNHGSFTNGYLGSAHIGLWAPASQYGGVRGAQFHGLHVVNCDENGVFSSATDLDIYGLKLSDVSHGGDNTYDAVVNGTGELTLIRPHFSNRFQSSSQRMRYAVFNSGTLRIVHPTFVDSAIGTGRFNSIGGILEGFYGNPGHAQEAVGAAATDLPSALVLVNNLRTALRNNGMVG